MSRDGFTLIELVLTIALLGVLSIAVVTLSVDYRRSHVEVAAQKVRSDIEHARGLATTKKGTTFGVFFNDAADTYTVYQGTVATPVKDPQTKQDLIETFARWHNLTITGGNYTVEFNSLGAPTTGGGGNVRITNGTVTYTISVTAGTGKVTVTH